MDVTPSSQVTYIYINIFFSFTWTQTLLQFFHVKGEGLTLEDMKSGDYKVGLLAVLFLCPSSLSVFYLFHFLTVLMLL